MKDQLNRVKEKLSQLKNLDKTFVLFGSNKHRYKIRPTISLDTIHQFETKYNVTLPKDYVGFLTEIGNGGAGPFYGLKPFEDSLYSDLDFKKPEFLLNPGKPFIHTRPWNIVFQPTVKEEENPEEYDTELRQFEELYFAGEQKNGVLAICNYGCGISMNLVVNGEEYGNIWTDDRASDNGIYPSLELGNKDKIAFLNWYELWLDTSIAEIKGKLKLKEEQGENKTGEVKHNKPWWKIW